MSKPQGRKKGEAEKGGQPKPHVVHLVRCRVEPKIFLVEDAEGSSVNLGLGVPTIHLIPVGRRLNVNVVEAGLLVAVNIVMKRLVQGGVC
jgi:hypothetical protein